MEITKPSSESMESAGSFFWTHLRDASKDNSTLCMKHSPFRTLLVGAVLIILTPTLGFSQSQSALQRANGLLFNQNYDAARTLLDSLTQAQPELPQGWLLLGQAHRGQQEYATARMAFHKAAAFEVTRGQALYMIGTAYALDENPTEAFFWLQRAKATNTFNMTNIGNDPNAASLREDPRYMALFPTAAEYADPFVEETIILQDWPGEAAGDQFGWIARNIGDVDGDGVNDVTTSAPTSNAGGTASGKMYTYSGKTGALLWSHTGEPNANMGLGIEAAGDVNADGIPDVVVGAPGIAQAYVYSGDDGRVLLKLESSETTSLFGRKATDIGDVNGDGHADVLIGDPRSDVTGQDAGSAFLYSGKDGALLLTLRGEEAGDTFGTAVGGFAGDGHLFLVVGAANAGAGNRGRTYVYKDLTEEPAFIIESDENGFNLGGMFVSAVGDVNNDGTPDIYASDWAHGANGSFTGQVYIHSGTDGTRLYTLPGEAAGDGFGIGTADVGDVNNDGYDDLLIGAWQHGSVAPSGGKAYLYSGKDATLLHTITGKVPGETFGFDATGMGDVDGDGIIDFLLTSAWSAIQGTQSGRMFILSGATALK